MSVILIKILAIWTVIFEGTIILLNLASPDPDPSVRATVLMGTGLIVIWCIIGGTLMWRYRNSFKQFFQGLPLRWPLKFILFATLFALLEEVVTVTMTNMAPVFGSEIGEAFATASANYFHTVLGNSVIIFVGWFVAWGWLLTKYEFTTPQMFLIAGFVGSLAESSFGFAYLIAGYFFFVYGLMVFLPAYSIPQNRGLPKPGLKAYLLAVILPFIFMIPFGLLRELYIYLFNPTFFI